MDSFTLLIIILLILSIANNFIMYQKCYSKTHNMCFFCFSEEFNSANLNV